MDGGGERPAPGAGTRLDDSDETDLIPDPDDPEGPMLAVYGYLGFLLESMVSALSD